MSEIQRMRNRKRVRKMESGREPETGRQALEGWEREGWKDCGKRVRSVGLFYLSGTAN